MPARSVAETREHRSTVAIISTKTTNRKTYDGGVYPKHRFDWLLCKAAEELLTVRRRRQARTCRRSGIHPDTGALSGCLRLSPYWELYRKTRTAAPPSLSSSSYTGPWRDTGSTGTQTIANKKTTPQMWCATSNAGCSDVGKMSKGAPC